MSVHLKKTPDPLFASIRSINPAAIIFDHSPTALLAARDVDATKFTIGHGFYVPRDESPMSSIRKEKKTDSSALAAVEEEVTSRINQVMRSNSQTVLPYLAALYSDGVKNLFTTYAELDHFGPRPGANYFGTLSVSTAAGLTPVQTWPNGQGARVFLYLKAMPHMTDLLKFLSSRRNPVVAVFDGVSPRKFQSVVGTNILLCDSPVSLRSISETADVAITNAGHGTICELLLAGISQMLIPLTLEQAILSARVKSLGAGLDARRDELSTLLQHLTLLLDEPDRFGGASAFRMKYAARSESAVVEHLSNAITE